MRNKKIYVLSFETASLPYSTDFDASFILHGFGLYVYVNTFFWKKKGSPVLIFFSFKNYCVVSFWPSMMPLASLWKFALRAAARAALRCRKNCSYRLVHSRATHYLKTGTICQDFVLLPFELGPEYFLGESEVRRFIHQLWLTDIWIGHSLIRTINLCFHKMSLQKKQRAWIFNDWFLLNS